MASEHPAMELARRGPRGKVDTFLAFWLGMLADGRQAKFESSRVRTRRAIDAFLAGRAVQAAREELGDDALAAELRDAAELYFRTCLTDVSYTTSMFRTKRLTDDELVAKAAKEAVGAMAVILESGARDPFAGRLPLALAHGFLEVMPGTGPTALRTALGAHRTTAHLVGHIPDDGVPGD